MSPGDDEPPAFRDLAEAMEYLVVPDWPRDLLEWPKWTWAHLTYPQTDGETALPFKAVYAILVDRSGLPGPTRAVLQHLARRCDREGSRHRRTWPPIEVICDRTGFGRSAVKAALRRGERVGWINVVRHTKRPSDYVLDVPELECCPCGDCAKGSGDDRQGSGDDRQTVGRRPPVGREATTHLGSSTSVPHVSSFTGIAAGADDPGDPQPASHPKPEGQDRRQTKGRREEEPEPQDLDVRLADLAHRSRARGLSDEQTAEVVSSYRTAWSDGADAPPARGETDPCPACTGTGLVHRRCAA